MTANIPALVEVLIKNKWRFSVAQLGYMSLCGVLCVLLSYPLQGALGKPPACQPCPQFTDVDVSIFVEVQLIEQLSPALLPLLARTGRPAALAVRPREPSPWGCHSWCQSESADGIQRHQFSHHSLTEQSLDLPKRKRKCCGINRAVQHGGLYSRGPANNVLFRPGHDGTAQPHSLICPSGHSWYWIHYSHEMHFIFYCISTQTHIACAHIPYP